MIAKMAVSAGVLDPKSYTTTPPLEMRLTHGGIIEGRSWDKATNLRGPTVYDGVSDEFGGLNSDAYGELSARRAETISRGYGHWTWIGNVGEIGGPAEVPQHHIIAGYRARIRAERTTLTPLKMARSSAYRSASIGSLCSSSRMVYFWSAAIIRTQRGCTPKCPRLMTL